MLTEILVMEKCLKPGLIGYSIRPSQRGKGYASEMLKLALNRFKNTNTEKILITCKGFNLASKKVIEKNGGVFENTYTNQEDGYTYLRYWIKILEDSNNYI